MAISVKVSLWEKVRFSPWIPYSMEQWLEMALGTAVWKRSGAAPTGPSFKRDRKNWSTVSELPRPVPNESPIRFASSILRTRPESSNANRTAETMIFPILSILLRFTGLIKVLKSISGSCPPNLDRYELTSNPRIGLIPEVPWRQCLQNSSFPIPMEKMIPKPVTTTRWSGFRISDFGFRILEPGVLFRIPHSAIRIWIEFSEDQTDIVSAESKGVRDRDPD